MNEIFIFIITLFSFIMGLVGFKKPYVSLFTLIFLMGLVIVALNILSVNMILLYLYIFSIIINIIAFITGVMGNV